MVERVLTNFGVELVPITMGAYPLVITGLGSGICMAFADYLVGVSDAAILMSELPGRLGVEKRCVVLDYLNQAYPMIFLQWSSLQDAEIYPRFLEEQRGFRTNQPLWVYVRGVGRDRAANRWRRLGAGIIDNLWTWQQPG